MYVVTMCHGWHESQFTFEDMWKASDFMKAGMEAFVPNDEQELEFKIQKIECKEDTDDAETVCGTEEG